MKVSLIPRSCPPAPTGRRWFRTAALVAAAACVTAGPAALADQEVGPATTRSNQATLPKAECPSSLPASTTCYSGRQKSGAYYWIAVPEKWSGDLVVHAHGGPGLGAADPERSLDDLDRWSVMVEEGFAWAGTRRS